MDGESQDVVPVDPGNYTNTIEIIQLVSLIMNCYIACNYSFAVLVHLPFALSAPIHDGENHDSPPVSRGDFHCCC